MDNEQALSMNPYMLLSWINMKLRDEKIDFKELCSIYDMDEDILLQRLEEIGYKYNSSTNQFK